MIQRVNKISISQKIQLGLLSLTLMGPLRLDVYGIFPMIGPISLISLAALWARFLLFPSATQKRTWMLLLFIPPLILCLTAIWSYRFNIFFGGDLSSNLLAQRWFFYWLLYPIGLALYENGMPLRKILHTIYITFILVLAIFAFRQLTIDFSLELTQGDNARYIRNDSFRGYRLYFAQYAFYAALYVSLAGAFFAKKNRWLFAIGFFLLAALYSQVYSRLHIAESILVISFTALAFGDGTAKIQPIRQIISMILFITLGLIAIPFAVDYLSADKASGQWRLNSLEIILNEFSSRPWFGTGPGSTQSISLGDIFGAKFAPSDLGLIGITFVFGIVGLAIDIFLLLKVWNAARLGFNQESGSFKHLRVAFLWLALFFLIGSTSFALIWTPDSIIVACIILILSELLNREHKTQPSQ